MSIVPREAVVYYKSDFAEHPVGSGPFKLDSWQRNYKIEFVRNPDFRKEFFPDAVSKADQAKRLPLLDRVVCYQINEPISSWLLFLQGNIDLSAVDKDSFEAIVTDKLQLIPALKKQGIKMMRIPKFQIHYIGFCFTDPVLAENLNLRKAISLAYNVKKRVTIWNNQIMPANGPIPAGVPGYDPKFKNQYSIFNINQAKKYMKKAGYPDGIDPKTGQQLELTLDIGGTASIHRQIAELFVEDMEKIGIKIIPSLNNWPRFLQKSAKGEVQLYSVSWVGDYPDAENFLQLFYGPNAGSCNRSYYRDPKFDKMYDEIKTMPDTPERSAKYAEMAEYLTEQCPWIFSHYPISYRLKHSWVENYLPHDFSFSRWKYLSIDYKKRTSKKADFKPLN
jgi:ABC-type transport system substrate-binding protein